MKFIPAVLLVLTMLMGATAVRAQEKAKPDPYMQAVMAYVDAAARQLRAIRAEVDGEVAKASPERKGKYAAVFAGLDQLDQAVDNLKKTSPNQFDALKAEFEKKRAALIGLLTTVRQGS